MRNFNNTPELYILEKIIKKGYLISNIYLEFDGQGKVKNNYKFKGFIKDGKVSIFKAHEIEKLNFFLKFLIIIFKLKTLIFLGIKFL